jgi:hypothetical protein
MYFDKAVSKMSPELQDAMKGTAAEASEAKPKTKKQVN